MGRLSRYLLAAEVIFLALPVTLFFLLGCLVMLSSLSFYHLDWEALTTAALFVVIACFLISFWTLVVKFYLSKPKAFSERNQIHWALVYVAIMFTFLGSALAIYTTNFGHFSHSILMTINNYAMLSTAGLPVVVPTLHLILARRKIIRARRGGDNVNFMDVNLN